MSATTPEGGPADGTYEARFLELLGGGVRGQGIASVMQHARAADHADDDDNELNELNAALVEIRALTLQNPRSRGCARLCDALESVFADFSDPD